MTVQAVFIRKTLLDAIHIDVVGPSWPLCDQDEEFPLSQLAGT
jgi:hypothetical protein